MKVASLFVRCLENEGVEYVFGLPGEENEELLFALEESKITFVPTRHEQGAAFMANLWGRLTGRAGVCLSTLGPGATNLITGIADAQLDKAPLVAITAQASLTRLHHESHQSLDVVNMLRPITKWNVAVASPHVVSEVVRKAFKVAQTQKSGATHIELSEDVASAEEADHIRPIPPHTMRRPVPDAEAVQAAAKLIREARRPLVVAGNGVVRNPASRQLTRLAEQFGIPVTNTYMAKGAISANSEQSLLGIGFSLARDFVMEAVDSADLILAVGYDTAECRPDAFNPKGDKKVVHLDFTPADVYAHYAPAVELLGDIGAGLDLLRAALDKLGFKGDRDWYRPVRRRVLDDIRGYDLADGDDLTIPGALNVLREQLDDESLLISDVGSHKLWIARNFPTCCPNGCIISNGLASMGIALPGAIAASLADPDRQIVAAMGDGGFLMNAQELETARRVGAKFTAVIFNDNAFGQIAWKQRLSRGHAFGTRLTNPDFKRFVESFDIPAYQPRTVPELREQLAAAIASRELCAVEIPVDPEVNADLVDRLNRYWRERQ